VKTSFTVRTGTTFGFAFRKSDAALRDRVEEILECMKLDGTVAKLHEKWLGGPPSPGSAAVTVREGYGEPGFEGYDSAPHEARCRP
jgi:polar amino acid transport system substrate-binding protein